MEEVSEKFIIHLRIGRSVFPVTIERHKEEIYRAAEKLINERIDFYNKRYSNQNADVYMRMAMLDLAVSVKTNETRNDTKPYQKSMETLLQEVEETLKIKRKD